MAARSLNRYNKTRIAPTPSGFLHLGNVLSFAITTALAREAGAGILLRIDDLDRDRVNPEYINDIFDTLNFLQAPWNEGPRDAADFEQGFSQLHRLGLYNQALAQLSDAGAVYACTCSRSKLLQNAICTCRDQNISLSADNVSWRLFTDQEQTINIKTFTGDTIQATLPDEMQHFIVKRKNGYPAYQLSSVVDDLFYGIDLVVRGQDLWPSTLAQQQLATALGNKQFGQIAFYHHPLLTDEAGNKLSKSAGATSVHYLRKNGKKAANVCTLVARMAGITQPVNNWDELVGAVSATILLE